MALNVATQLGHYSVTGLIGEGVLGFAEHILTNAARLWAELGIDGKQDLQQALSPQGLSFDRQEFGTAVTSLIFKHIEALRPTGTDVVSPRVPSWNQLLGWLKEMNALGRSGPYLEERSSTYYTNRGQT